MFYYIRTILIMSSTNFNGVTEVFVDGAPPSLVATCRSSIPALQLSTMVSPTLSMESQNGSVDDADAVDQSRFFLLKSTSICLICLQLGQYSLLKGKIKDIGSFTGMF
jgi:hypothetical protein